MQLDFCIMKNMSEAKQKIIYAFHSNNEIHKTNLYDHVMASLKMVNGEPDLHICQKNGIYELWTMGFAGQNPRIIDVFPTLIRAEEELFSYTWDDFLDDKTRNTAYFDTWEEASKYQKPEQVTETSKVEIRKNKVKNGIEIFFPAHPDPAILKLLNELGFKWSTFKKLWWARYSTELWKKAHEKFN